MSTTFLSPRSRLVGVHDFSRRSRFTRCDTHRNHFLIYPRRPINMDGDDSEFLPDETDENPDRVWWPRLSQFRSVGVRDFLGFQIGGCPRLSRPGTGPITTTTLESSTFNARRTRIVRRGFGVGRSPLDVKLRSRHSNRLIVSERWQPSRNFFKSQKYNTLMNRDFS